MHSSQLFRRIRSEEMDISKRHFVKKSWDQQNIFSAKNSNCHWPKTFLHFQWKEKNCCRSNEHFLLQNFPDKKYRMQQILYISARTKKNSFFFLIVKLFCHFMIDCSAEKLANSCFLPVDVFCEILPFILGNSSSDLHRVFFGKLRMRLCSIYWK